MNTKADIRKQLEAGLAIFLSEGKQIIKLNTLGKKRKSKPKLQDDMVEIEVECLPVALQKKYFSDIK